MSTMAVEHPFRWFVGMLGDAVALLVAVVMVPAAILLVGIPVALLLGVAVEMGQGVFGGLLTRAVPVVIAVGAAWFLARYLSRR